MNICKSVEMRITLLIYSILQLMISGVLAQGQISGNIKGNSEILFAATIRNISQHKETPPTWEVIIKFLPKQGIV